MTLTIELPQKVIDTVFRGPRLDREGSWRYILSIGGIPVYPIYPG
jgi:hypothetical protein